MQDTRRCYFRLQFSRCFFSHFTFTLQKIELIDGMRSLVKDHALVARKKCKRSKVNHGE